MADITSPPISTADRENLAEQRQAHIDNPSNTWFYQLYFHAALEAIPSYEARVVELEAALAELRGKYNDVRDTVGLWQERVLSAEAHAEASEARATALLEALTTAIKVADEAREEWDRAPSGMKAGKLLIALSDPSLKYRADITAMHAAIALVNQHGATNDQG